MKYLFFVFFSVATLWPVNGLEEDCFNLLQQESFEGEDSTLSHKIKRFLKKTQGLDISTLSNQKAAKIQKKCQRYLSQLRQKHQDTRQKHIANTTVGDGISQGMISPRRVDRFYRELHRSKKVTFTVDGETYRPQKDLYEEAESGSKVIVFHRKRHPSNHLEDERAN